jgi:hypothetical protein
MIPMSEVLKAKSNIHAAKHNIRATMKELSMLNGNQKKWTCLMSPEQQESFKKLEKEKEGEAEKQDVCDDDDDDDDGGGGGGEIDVEDVGCSICLSLESTEDNDILLCDRDGCFRAYHMK